MLFVAVGAGVFVVVLLIANVVRFLTAPPKILSITPSVENENIDPSAPILVTLSKEVDITDLSASAQPSATFAVTRVEGTTYAFTPDPYLHTNTPYSVIIYYKTNTSLGGTLFTTLTAQSDPVILQEAERWMEDNYPLANNLPVITPEYELYYLRQKTLAVRKLAETMTDEQAKQVAEDFLKRYLADPSTHEVVVVQLSAIPPTTTVESSNR